MSSIQETELLREALRTGDYSDLTISCGNHVHRVHRVIVCPQSKVLDAMCRSSFKEGKTGVINLPDDDPEVVTAMISSFYGQDYEDALDDRYGVFDSDLPLDARIYSVAHKYDIPGLENLAKERFGIWAELRWNSPDFPGIVQEIWSSEGYKGLYDVISKTIAEHVNWFLDIANGELIKTGLSSGKLSAEFVCDVVEATEVRILGR